MFKNKKGQGLSINTVIITILAIFVLVLVVLISTLIKSTILPDIKAVMRGTLEQVMRYKEITVF